MKLNILGTEYTLEQLEEITGNKKRDFDIQELLKMKPKQINQLLKEELNVIPGAKWSKDYKVAVALFGFKGKCNGFKEKQIEGFSGFCKGKPSKDIKGNCNGRCISHSGRSDKKKPNGRKQGDPELKGNTIAAVHMGASRRRKALKEEIKASFFKKDLSDLDNQIIRLDDQIASQMALIEDMEVTGLYGLDEIEFVPSYNRFGEIDIDEDKQKAIKEKKKQISLMDLSMARKELTSLETLRLKLIEMKELKLNEDKDGKGGNVIIQFSNNTNNAMDIFNVDKKFLPPSDKNEDEGEE
ncbi:hypothetical protein NSS82_19100 [Paenibacillus sp. FSL H7-0735]|uniref:hypothetical protein n=1 Tax=Paenibacillus sp. FSL H7-0735 TaxID=2954736 RepID=UPI0030F93CB9